MIKRPFRSLKVPLVFGGQWKDHQTFQKWDPISKRLIQVNCCLPGRPVPCSNPLPVDSVSVSPSSGTISWTYSGIETIFEVKLYESATLPVVPNGTVVFTNEGALTSPYSTGFTPTNNYYYFASVRVKDDCGYSSYVYSSVEQYTCPIPSDPTNVVLSSLTETGASISWDYSGIPASYEVNIYQSATSPVDTHNSPIFTDSGSLTSPYSASFTPTIGYYYVASVRAYNACGYSGYAYSNERQFSYRFERVNTSAASDPGTENFSSNLSIPNFIFNFNKTALGPLDASNYLNSIATDPPPTTIVVTKDISNYSSLTINSRTDMGTYWTFNCSLVVGVGNVAFGDTATLTYS